uniref:Metaxin glutathione S-transferase domain-containing protein n=1 Tax=Acrobeloides nanus TaxID=290746 RepID=A0A914EHI9_9BILA
MEEDNLTEEQKAIERAFDRLLDGSFVYSSNLLKMQDHWEEYSGLILDMHFSPTIVGFAKKLFAPFLKMKVIERFTAEGTARHSTDEIISMMRNDLKAIQTYLGNKEFFFGDKPSMIDAAIFGHVAAVYFVSYSHIVKNIIIAEFPIVLKYVKRMGKKYYSDFKFEN